MATEAKLRQLADKGCPVYYFYSTERYLVRQAVNAAVRVLSADSDEDATVLDGAAPEIEGLIMAAGTISFFGTRRVVALPEVDPGAYGAKDPDNHTGKLAWDITETHHEQAWTCCGLITVAKAAHTFGDWVVTKRPTSREEGEKARTCSVCGYTETKVLPKTGGGPTYYTLVFESNGGSKITNVNERHGTVVDLTLAKYQPTRTGYDFTAGTVTRRSQGASPPSSCMKTRPSTPVGARGSCPLPTSAAATGSLTMCAMSMKPA